MKENMLMQKNLFSQAGNVMAADSVSKLLSAKEKSLDPLNNAIYQIYELSDKEIETIKKK